MGQAHYIAKSFKDVVAATPPLNNALPGNLHYGTRVDTSTVRPYGLLDVKELDRRYHSGGSAFVRYEVTLTVVGRQWVEEVGVILDQFAAAFNEVTSPAAFALPSFTGQIMLVRCQGTTLTESVDQVQEAGKDIMVGTITWIILTQETELILV